LSIAQDQPNKNSANMNLIASESKLDLQQEKAIYELTLKKQRSKKSTISQKQVAAMQQLASELITQRKDFNYLIDHNQNNLDHHHHHHHPHHANDRVVQAKSENQNGAAQQQHIKRPATTTTAPANQRQAQLSRCTKSTTSSSFISNTSSSSAMSDVTNIKLNQLRLEQLNNELERRLHQYEYLVAQEKAILSAYKMSLFTNEGVNNFRAYERIYERGAHAGNATATTLGSI
jgi:hypothetical protein